MQFSVSGDDIACDDAGMGIRDTNEIHFILSEIAESFILLPWMQI